VSGVDKPAGLQPAIDWLYGTIPVTDTKLLATAAQLRSQWEEGGVAFYPINKVDKEQFGIGPLFGRYPGDVYDGDTSHPVLGGHPWALSTCNAAELHYKLAAEIKSSGGVPMDDLSRAFFAQSGIDGSTAPAAAAALVARVMPWCGRSSTTATIWSSPNSSTVSPATTGT
jgi:glucoamylase